MSYFLFCGEVISPSTPAGTESGGVSYLTPEDSQIRHEMNILIVIFQRRESPGFAVQQDTKQLRISVFRSLYERYWVWRELPGAKSCSQKKMDKKTGCSLRLTPV